MRTITLLLLPCFLPAVSCKPAEQPATQEEARHFGIYAILTPNELSASFAAVLKADSILMPASEMQSPFLASIRQEDLPRLNMEYEQDGVRLAVMRINDDALSTRYAIVALPYNAALDISDVQKATPGNNNVDLQFNMEGSRKWADLTRSNTGRMVAFVVDNTVYSMPYVKAEIRTGTARISGLENEETAENLSLLISSYIP